MSPRHHPDQASYTSYPGSGEGTGDDSMHFIADYNSEMDLAHLHAGYVGALQLLGESFANASDPICNERAILRLLRVDDPYSCVMSFDAM